MSLTTHEHGVNSPQDATRSTSRMKELRRLLLDTAEPTTWLTNMVETGGLLDVEAAVRAAERKRLWLRFQNGQGQALALRFPSLGASVIVVTLFSISLASIR